MSQPPQDFVDPADAAPATPVPVTPVERLAPPPLPPPVQVVAQPYSGPMSVLPYTMPATNARPGLVTAIGIASIIIGCLAMLTGAMTSLISVSFMIASSAANRAGAAVVDPMGPNGYDIRDRRTIVQAMNLKQKMSTAQRDNLQWFVSDVGKTYVPSVPITSGDAVTSWGDTNVSDSGTGVEGTWFDLPMGRLTVTDKSASFDLKDGSTITRSSIRQMPNPSDPSQLSPQEVGALVNRAQELTYGQQMTAQQVTGLTQALQTQSAQLIGPQKDMPTLLGQVYAVTPSNGFYTVQLKTATLMVYPSGHTIVTSGGAPGSPGGPPKLAGTPASIVVIENILSLALSIYLLVIGILTLRNSPAGGTMHKVYAWLKILLAIVGGAGLWWLIVGSGGTAPWAWVSGVLTMVLGLIYPIILLLVLPSKSVKEWYTVEHAK